MTKRIILFFALLVASLVSLAQTPYNIIIPGVGNIYYMIEDDHAVIVNPNSYFKWDGRILSNKEWDGYTYSYWGGYTKPTGALTIPSTIAGYPVTAIEAYAFDGCNGLTSVTIPNSVTTIGERAFNDCNAFFVAPYSVRWSFAGSNCGSVIFYEVINCEATIVAPQTGDRGVGDWYSFSSVMPKGELVIPSTIEGYPVTTIYSGAFSQCTGLTSVTIPRSVTSIKARAFEGCSNLNVYYDGNMKEWCSMNKVSQLYPNYYYSIEWTVDSLYIDNCLIEGHYVVPSSVNMIGDGAFAGCIGLTSVTIPNSVKTIGILAFDGCIGLTSVTIPSSVKEIGYGNFSGCIGLPSLTIPNSITTIGNYAFYGCTGLTSVTIPNSVTKIGVNAFSDCTGLTSVTIPSSVNSINSRAFSYCSNISEIYAKGNPAPMLAEGVFEGLSNTTSVYIPCGSSSSYYQRWGNVFYSFIETPAPGFVDMSENNNKGTVKVVTAPTCTSPQAVIQATANAGYRFDHWSDGSTQNPYTLTINQDMTLKAYFVSTSGGTEGISDVQDATFSIYSSANGITVTGADNQRVTVYNVQGMPVAIQQSCPNTFTFAVPSTGIYFVQVGNSKAQRVVMLR